MISPSIDPSLSLQPASMMAPLTQQMGHLSLGSAGTVRETCMRLTERLFDSLYFCLRGKKIIKICLFWFVNSLIFHFLAVYGSQYSYARSIYPTVSASADSHCSCGSMCSNKIAASLLAKYFAPPPKKKTELLLFLSGKQWTVTCGLIRQSFPLFLSTNKVVLR